MRRLDSTTIGIIVIFILLIGGAIIAFVATKNNSTVQYNVNDRNRPELIIGQTNFDFGKMSVSEVKTQDIIIKNGGRSPLVLSDFITSCDCTFVQVIINGQASSRFSMHRNRDWQGEILPDTSAIVRIIYEPKIMPVKGKVKREIIFKTNDPNQPVINLSFNAEVE